MTACVVGNISTKSIDVVQLNLYAPSKFPVETHYFMLDDDLINVTPVTDLKTGINSKGHSLLLTLKVNIPLIPFFQLRSCPLVVFMASVKVSQAKKTNPLSARQNEFQFVTMQNLTCC